MRGERLTARDVVGRYVLRDEGQEFERFGRPRVALRLANNRIAVESEQPEAVPGADGNSRLELTGRGTRAPAGFVEVADVRCICDTPEDVNAVVREGERVADAFDRLREEARRRLRAMHGTVSRG